MWIEYENTGDNDYVKGTEIYLPIPKTTIAYDHFFYNADLNNPAGVEDGKSANKIPGWTAVLTSAADAQV
jgi:hypothetical protein